MAFRAVGLREHFDVVVTASDTTEHKPSPVPLRLCLERLGAPAARARSTSATAPSTSRPARAAGMATAAVAWGVFGREALLASRPGLLARASPRELLALCLRGEGRRVSAGRGRVPTSG